MDYQERVRRLIEGLGTWYEDPGQLKSGIMTKDLHPYDKLFSPIRINGVTVKNRIVMGPMGNINMAEETGRPSNKMIEYFCERAKGGVGLITSGLIPISHGVDPTVTEASGLSYFPRIDASRTRFSGWRDLSERLHAHGSRFFIQLTPGLGRVGSPESLLTKHKLPVSASWNPNFYIPGIPCRPLTDRQCRTIIKNAGQASADAKAALIDGVYLHGHEGYLLEQMTNPAFNRRSLGRYRDWQAFGLDLVKEIRKRTGVRYPIMYRIDLSLALNETYGQRMRTVKSLKKFAGERTVEMTLEYMHNLVKAGVDMFDVDLGCYDNWWLPHPPSAMPPGCFLEVAQITKEYFAAHDIKSNAGLPVPIVAVGKLGYPDLAEQALRDDKCDMIMLGRPLLADPHWPNKAFAGKVASIIPCIGDQEGCINEFVEGGHPQCSVNPFTGFEDLGTELKPTANPKRVAVVGGGPAGCNVAIFAALRGHQVTLYERGAVVGGMLIPGSSPKIKFDILNYRRWLENQLASLSGRIDLRLNTSITADELKAQGYDAIVTATGTAQRRPPVEGIEQAHFAIDFLNRPELAAEARHVVVVGGGEVGCETAYMLAHELGKHVKVVEMLPNFMQGACTANRGFLIHHLEKLGVELCNYTKLAAIKPGKVTVERNVGSGVPDAYNTWTPLLPENIENPLAPKIKDDWRREEWPADLVLLAAGNSPADELYNRCRSILAAPEIRNIADSFSPGRVFEAVKAAFLTAQVL